ncbi:MAG: hypothetical protein ACTHME_09125 [Candidatus Nitrosocosmicus sp.]
MKNDLKILCVFAEIIIKNFMKYDRSFIKPLHLKSFMGLIEQQIDIIFQKEIIKRYIKYEIKRLSKMEGEGYIVSAVDHSSLS